MDITLQRIIEELKSKNLRQIDLTNFLGTTHNTFGNWKSGLNKSYLKYLHAIASYLDVDVEYLKGETDIKKAPLSEESEAAAEFANLYESLTAEQRQLILAAMRGMSKEQ
jgi:transcriptional regulator with XRE-family HTH domain